MSDLTTLRAEVERLRDESRDHVAELSDANPGKAFRVRAADLADRVLDLIDKHTREGQ